MTTPRIIVARLQAPQFRSHVFESEWDRFVEAWAPKCYAFVLEALGPYGTEPLPDINPMSDAAHAAGANASFNMLSGQITLHPYMEGRAGTTLEKMTHEMVHGSLSKFPDRGGDPFFDEGVVDHMVSVLARSSYWGDFREEMVEAALFNLALRRERALSTRTEYDRSRWMGGICSRAIYGNNVVAAFKLKKLNGDYSW